MKAFENWDQKEYPLPPCYERGPVGREALKQRKHTWRAALEWALTQAGWQIEDITEAIDKELKG